MAILDKEIIRGFYQQFDNMTFNQRKELKYKLLTECNWSDQTFCHKKLGHRRLMIPKKGNKIKINEVQIVKDSFANFGITINTNNSQS